MTTPIPVPRPAAEARCLRHAHYRLVSCADCMATVRRSHQEATR